MDMEAILQAEFTLEEASYALDAYNFSDWRRSWTRDGHQLLPREAPTGPSGGRFRWAHLVEMRLFRELEISLSRLRARAVLHDFFFQMYRRAYQKISSLSVEEQKTFMAAGGFNGGFPPEKDRYNFGAFVTFPNLMFDPELFGQGSDPRWLVFAPAHAPNSGDGFLRHLESRICPGWQPLGDAQRAILEARRNIGMSTELRRYDDDRCNVLMSVNISSIVYSMSARIDARLKDNRLGNFINRL